MGWQACLTEIKGATRIEDMTDDEAQQMLDDVLARKERIMRERGLAADPAYLAAAKELAEQKAMQAAIEKRNRLNNLLKRKARRERITAQGPEKAVDGLRAELHGINTPRPGGRFSAQAEWHSIVRQYLEGSTAEIRAAGLFEAARNGAIDLDIARELAERSKMAAGGAGKPGITGNEVAGKIADIWHRYMMLAKKNLNDAGAWIGDYFDYVAHTSHDPDKIRRAGHSLLEMPKWDHWKAFQAWYDFTMPRLDHLRTFEGVKDIHEFMAGVYNGLITGIHMTPDGMVGFKDPAFVGPGNAAKRLSKSRVLHWRDADAWLEYQQQFGNGKLNQAVLRSLNQSARWTALMRRWGTNPRAEFDADIRWVQEKYRDADPQSVNHVSRWKDALEHRFNYLDGSANVPVSRLSAKIGNIIRLDESMSKLGSVLLTHLSAGMTRSAELWHHGISPFEAYTNYFSSIFKAISPEQRKFFADHLGAGMDMAVHDLEQRFEPEDGIPGALSAIANTFFKWSGLSPAFSAWRGGLEALLSHNLGRQVESRFAALPEPTQRMLGMYGIDHGDWDIIRKAGPHEQVNGRTYLTPAAIQRADGDAIASLLRARGSLAADAKPTTVARATAAYRQEIANRLNAYFVDSSERGMIIPGIEDRAILLQGTKPGTALGEMLRFMAQFKVWPTALITKGLGREIFSSSTWKGAGVGIAHMALAGAIFGYIRMASNDLFNGRSPRDPMSPKTWFAALAQGGGVGILGDFLFGEYNRFGGGFLSTLAGPAGTDLNTIVDVYNRAKEGKHIGGEMLHFAVNHVPFVNLFYTRLALNYMLLWHAYEAASPGWARRQEQRARTENGQTFWLKPSQAVR